MPENPEAARKVEVWLDGVATKVVTFKATPETEQALIDAIRGWKGDGPDGVVPEEEKPA